MSGDLKLHKENIGKGSKSFALASLLFSRQQKESAWRLYSWCRYCDDQIDDVESSEAGLRLQQLENSTQNIFSEKSQPLAFRGMAEAMKAHSMPAQ